MIESLEIVGGGYDGADEFAVLTSETPRLHLATRLVMDLSQDDAAK